MISIAANFATGVLGVVGIAGGFAMFLKRQPRALGVAACGAILLGMAAAGVF